MAQKCCYTHINAGSEVSQRVRWSLIPNSMRLTGITLCEIILPTDKNPSIFWGSAVPAVVQNGVEQTVESDYEIYLKQRSLNAVLTKTAVVAGAWFAVGALTLSVAVFMRPEADVVGMDPAGREHPIVISKLPLPAAGVKH